jgi:hypothetical protein
MSKKYTNKQFMESMAKQDSLLDHDIETCGMCFHNWVMAEVAREMVKEKVYDIDKWCEEAKRRWQEGKYFKLYQEEVKAGREPTAAFAERGWEM